MPKFWIPIIALYHGCRLNEICQLDVNDIVQEKGIPCININDKWGTKTTLSKYPLLPSDQKALISRFCFNGLKKQEEKTVSRPPKPKEHFGRKSIYPDFV